MESAGNIGVIILWLIVTVFFCLTLYNTLVLIKPWNRKIKPSWVWLLFVPLFNFFWNFFVVTAISSSIKRELEERNFEVTDRPGFVSGMFYSVIYLIAAIAPYIMAATGVQAFTMEDVTAISSGNLSVKGWFFVALGILGLLQLIFFIQYWMKINWYKTVLKNDDPEEVQE